MSKKILTFSLAYYPSFVSGAEAAIKEITNRINKEEIEFHIITHLFEPDAPKQEEIDNVVVHRVGFGGSYLSKILFVPLAALKARSLHKEHTFDGMWVMMTYMVFPLQLARWIGVKLPYTITFQDGDPYEKVFERWFIRPFAWILDAGIRGARVIQAISVYLAGWAPKRGYTGEVILVPNGANPKNFTQFYSDEELEAVKAKLGKKENEVYLFIAARMVYQKAMDSIIRSLTLLPEHIKFVVAGQGPDEEMLRELTKELNLEERVILLGGLTRDEVPLYRNTIVSDIVVHPSRSEGLGNSVLSSMAARLPVIATQVGGFKDFIFDEKRDPDKQATAWAVDPDSPEQIAKAVEEILTDPEKAAGIAAHARKRIDTEFNWDVVAKRMSSEVFNKLFV